MASRAQNRVNLLREHLLQSSVQKAHAGLSLHLVHSHVSVDEEAISIVDSDGNGCTVAVRKHVNNPELIPRGYLKLFVETDESSGALFLSQEVLAYFQFLMKKQLLGQDVFLLGPPTRLKRALALGFCELFHLEVEFVAISQDTTVSDLKQRREIRNGSAIFTDGPAVRSAIYGRILVLDGIEKAERNVLSVLNNLLENREMNLEDGRFLTSTQRYDNLTTDKEAYARLKENYDGVQLVRVSPEFRVMSIGIPVPEYEGNALDPPFRSRFQACDVSSLVKTASRKLRSSKVERVLKVQNAFRSALEASLEGVSSRAMRRTEFPADLNAVESIFKNFPSTSLRFVLTSIYPYSSMPWYDPLQLRLLMDIFLRQGILPLEAEPVQSLEARWFQSSSKRQTWTEIRDEQRQMENVGMSAADAARRSFWIGENQNVACGYVRSSTTYSDDYVTIKLQEAGDTTKETSISLNITESSTTSNDNQYVSIPYHEEILTQMIIFHASNLDFCLIGKRGVGKSALVRKFCDIMKSEAFYFPLFKDMTSQDIFQRRTTLSNGDTVWMPSPLTSCCLTGGIVILDGLDQVPPSTISCLQSLIHDRFMTLPDGTRFLSSSVYNDLVKGEYDSEGHVNRLLKELQLALPESGPFDPEYLFQKGIRCIHPSFRIIGIGRPHSFVSGNSTISQSWLNPETTSIFMPFIYVRSLTEDEESHLLHSSLNKLKSSIGLLFVESEEPLKMKGGLAEQIRERKLIENTRLDTQIATLVAFSHRLRNKGDDESKSIAGSLSTRQLLRLCKRIKAKRSSDLGLLIHNACLWRFLPELAQNILNSELLEAGITPNKGNEQENLKIKVEVQSGESRNEQSRFSQRKVSKRTDLPVIGRLTVGSVTVPIRESSNVLLVPQTLFYDNPRHAKTIQEMIVDFELGENLLLMGNQGVGKNKLADHFLHLLNIPRQYIQLDRDTTVNHLTSQPIVKDGILQFEDSPLVKAAIHGHTLVIDEADKAPTHVTAILKSLLADKEMLLGDGRRLVSQDYYKAFSTQNHNRLIPIHEDFQVIVLANRPGFPFLGNDFFREIGDIFACYVVENPDEESELELLRNYAKDVPVDTLRKLTIAFQDLRKLADEGVISYPYSTRELVNIVRHMQNFPEDGMAVILQNVFDFDQYSTEEQGIISKVFQKHGIPIALHSKYKEELGNLTPLGEPFLTEKWLRRSESRSLKYKVLDIPWRRNAETSGSFIFEMPKPRHGLKLNRMEGRSTNFSEEVFSFKLPITSEGFTELSSGVMDVCSTADGSLLFIANDSYHMLHLYKIFSGFRTYSVYQMYLPHFNFRGEHIRNVRKPAPSGCTIASLKNNRCCIFVPDDQTLYVMDLKTNNESLILIPIEVFREVERPHAPGQGPGLWFERQNIVLLPDLAEDLGILLLYRRGCGIILIVNIQADTMTTLSLPGVYIDSMRIISPTLWELIQGETADGLEESLNSVSDKRNTVYLLHAEGERIVAKSDTFMSSEEELFGVVHGGGLVPEPVSGNRNESDMPDSSIGVTFQSMIYDNFYLEPIHRVHVTSFEQVGLSKPEIRLYGEHSYVSSVSLPPEPIQMVQGVSKDRRCMYSKGTIAQVIEGLIETFDYNTAALNINTKNFNDEAKNGASVRSYLRTTSTAYMSFKEEVNAGNVYLEESHQLASLFLKDPGIPKLKGVRGGYFGFGTEAILEIVDFNKEMLRQIKVALPDTSYNARSLFSQEMEEDVQGLAETTTAYEPLNEEKDDTVRFRIWRKLLFMKELTDGNLLVLDRCGQGRVYEVDSEKLERSRENWKKLVGGPNTNDLDIDLDAEEDMEASDEDDEIESDDNETEYEETEEIEVEGDIEIVDGEISENAEGEFVMIKTKTKKQSSSKQRRGKASRAGGRRSRGSRRSSRLNRSSQQRSQGNRGRQGARQGNGSGSGSGSGGGMGIGTGGDGMFIPEPGQHRRLSSRMKSELEGRLKELEKLQKLFPLENRIREEIETIKARLEEADIAESMEDSFETLKSRMERATARLKEVQDALQKEDSPRLRTEEQQLRNMIDNLMDQISRQGPGSGTESMGSRGLSSIEKEVKDAAKKLAEENFKTMMEDLKLNPQELGVYSRYVESVKQEIRELRSTLDAMEAKKHQREWIRNKDSGDLDERRLIDGITGERNIYKRRASKPPDPFAFMKSPKRMTFLFDVSSSMSSYAMDGRMERSLEAAVMIMEAFKGYEHKFRYKFRGHSGSTDNITFVEAGKPPSTELQRLNVLRAMNLHSETCASGDNTLDATKLAINEIIKEEGDEYFVFLLSDANLPQYGITPKDLKYLLDLDQRVNLFIMFIGSMGRQAEMLRSELPQDKVFVTLNTSEIPKVLKRVFLSSVLKQA